MPSGSKSGEMLRSLAFEVGMQGTCRAMSVEASPGMGGQHRKGRTVYCAGFIHLPESQRETKYLGTQACTGLTSEPQSNF